MQQFLVIFMLVAMSAGLPQYGYGGLYHPNVQYQGYGGPFGWMPGFYGRSGYQGVPFPNNVASVQGGEVVANKISPGGFIAHAINNDAVNSSGVSSSWSYFPGALGQSNTVPTDPKTVTNDNLNQPPNVNSESKKQDTLPINSEVEQSPPASTKLTANEIKAAKESMLAYRENAAILLRQADQIEKILQQQ
ncbi:uncharacterized protein LOC124460319 [Drosophila willistoni]|uniref:uncharacterized protein LOC124460319 n=1 Tax=Drosophila willistoni TaxID=7260 RepID=UPI001F083616|nr:uncharacterized protein LOC124460319 [Drosophila willistoni]